MSLVYDVLNENLWTARDAYDSFHYLILPLNYAFKTGNDAIIYKFEEQFMRFLSHENNLKDFDNLAGLTKNHYLYLASEYMCLCSEYGYNVNKDLFNYIYSEMNQYVLEHKTNWQHYRNYDNLWDLFDGLIYGKGYESDNSLNNVFTDNETFPLAILCDLKFIADKNNYSEKEDINLSHAPKYAIEMLKYGISYSDGKSPSAWWFQVGVWQDHKDYKYAAINSPICIEEGIDYRINTIVCDTSHFMMRWPVFLNSWRRVQTNEENVKYISSLITGLGNTVANYVLVPPSYECNYYRVANYMDGTNGLFRYDPEKPEHYYGPYQESTSFLLGMWALCENKEIQEAYEYTCGQFPLDDEGKKVYEDPYTTRERNKIFMSNYYYEQLCYMASQLWRQPKDPVNHQTEVR